MIPIWQYYNSWNSDKLSNKYKTVNKLINLINELEIVINKRILGKIIDKLDWKKKYAELGMKKKLKKHFKNKMMYWKKNYVQ